MMSSSPAISQTSMVRMRTGREPRRDRTLFMSRVHTLVCHMVCTDPAGSYTAALVCSVDRVVVESCLSRDSVTGLGNDTLCQKPTCWQTTILPGVIMSIPHQELQHGQLCSLERVEEICASATCTFIRLCLMTELGLEVVS